MYACDWNESVRYSDVDRAGGAAGGWWPWIEIAQAASGLPPLPLATRIRGTLEPSGIAQHDPVQARFLAATGLDLYAARGESREHVGRKLRGLAEEVLAARDQVGQLDGLLQRQTPVQQPDDCLGVVGEDRRSARRAERRCGSRSVAST